MKKGKVIEMQNVFLVVGWTKGKDMKVVSLCKTKELAQEVKKSYELAGWEIVDIHELPVYEDFNSVGPWGI